MKPKKAVVDRAIANGAMNQVNNLLSAAHLLMCESNNLIDEASEVLKENGLLIGELKKYHSDATERLDRYLTEFATMIQGASVNDMFEDLEAFDKAYRKWTKRL